MATAISIPFDYMFWSLLTLFPVKNGRAAIFKTWRTPPTFTKKFWSRSLGNSRNVPFKPYKSSANFFASANVNVGACFTMDIILLIIPTRWSSRATVFVARIETTRIKDTFCNKNYLCVPVVSIRRRKNIAVYSTTENSFNKNTQPLKLLNLRNLLELIAE